MASRKTNTNCDLAIGTRLEIEELYRHVTEFARTALMERNRCALACGIASILNKFGVEEASISVFLNCQIDRELDCKYCSSCNRATQVERLN